MYHYYNVRRAESEQDTCTSHSHSMVEKKACCITMLVDFSCILWSMGIPLRSLSPPLAHRRFTTSSLINTLGTTCAVRLSMHGRPMAERAYVHLEVLVVVASNNHVVDLATLSVTEARNANEVQEEQQGP